MPRDARSTEPFLRARAPPVRKSLGRTENQKKAMRQQHASTKGAMLGHARGENEAGFGCVQTQAGVCCQGLWCDRGKRFGEAPVETQDPRSWGQLWHREGCGGAGAHTEKRASGQAAGERRSPCRPSGPAALLTRLTYILSGIYVNIRLRSPLHKYSESILVYDIVQRLSLKSCVGETP